jgi:hypothetical protein
MNLIDRVSGSPKPYPGLRPFTEVEVDVFFGRERQTDRLMEKLQQHRFLAIVGPSGCGKSSLVYAGLIPALQTGFMADAGSEWFVARLRPGDRPIASLASALLESNLIAAERAQLTEASALVEAALRRGPLGLVELALESGLQRGGNLLVLVDQFEELFRLGAQGNANEREAFVALLLRSAAEQGVRIYVCITMRSDFLGEAAAFHGLPEAINDGQYLTPQLEREECAAAISGPAAVFGGTIEPRLLNRLLNDFGPDPDQLPLLQHVLMRMWGQSTSAQRRASAKPILTVTDYEAAGGLTEALSKHADEAFEELSESDQRLAEVLFRRLSDARSVKRDTRSPARVSEIAAVAEVRTADVIRVANAFRRADRCFLSPRESIPLCDGSLLDVSHESLLRQWHRLVGWVGDEAESALFYQRLSETARAWKRGDAALWRVPDLDRALVWKDESRPTAAWAARYGIESDFELALEFLDASEEERRQEVARAEAVRVRQLRHARRVATFFAATAGALLLGILGYLILCVFDHRATFNSYVRVYGVPKGTGPRSTGELSHHPVSFRIIKSGYLGRVTRVEAIDSQGKLTNHHGVGTYLSNVADLSAHRKAAAWEYGYDLRGRITSETAYGIHGQVVYAFVYAPSSKPGNSTRSGYYVGADGLPDSEMQSASGIVIEYDSRGYERKVSYRGPGGEPIAAMDKAFGKLYEYDAEGNLIANTSLDRLGEPMNDFAGNSTMRATYNAKGKVTEQNSFDSKGRPTKLSEGWARETFQLDSWGNVIRTDYFDEFAKPVSVKAGFQRAINENDERGNPISIRYFDAAGARTADHEGCFARRLRFDERDRMTRNECLDEFDKPTLDASGCASRTQLFAAGDNDDVIESACLDQKGTRASSRAGWSRWTARYERGNQVESLRYDVDGRLTVGEEGYAGAQWSYDARNHAIKTTYLGPDAKPVMVAEGYASAAMDYDERGHLIRKRYFDTTGAPVMTKQGTSGFQARFDERGNRTEVKYLGLRGESAISMDGYAGWRTEFDGFGNELGIYYFGLRGEPIATASEGVASWRSTFDTWGNEVSRRFFGLDGRPVTNVSGIAEWRKTYDSKGNVLDERRFDVSGEPALQSWDDKAPKPKEGVARTTRKVDAQGHETELAFFGIRDEPIKNNDGWASVKHQYDAKGNQVSSRYFDIDQRPTRNGSGYHAVKRRFDRTGHAVEVRYFDVDDHTPMSSRGGYARLENGYDSVGHVTRQAVFGPAGEPVAIADMSHLLIKQFDTRGNLIKEERFGVHDEPVAVQGVHRTLYSRDERGNALETRYFDAKEEPVEDSGGCELRRFSYDADGNQTREECLSSGGQERLDPQGFAHSERSYGSRHELLAEAYFGLNSLPAKKDGYAKVTYEYDDLGRIKQSHYWGIDGKPTLTQKDGLASLATTYDIRGDQVELLAYGTHDEPIVAKLGFHRQTNSYDARHQLLESATYDTLGHLIKSRAGYARSVHKYDVRGNLLEFAAFGPDNRPTITKEHFARRTRKYDAQNQLVEEAYFDDHARPIDTGSGARQVLTYDVQGNRTEIAYFGANGRPLFPIAKSSFAFNDLHQVTEQRFIGPNGARAAIPGTAWHLTRPSYDAFGNKVEERYFDVRDQPTRGADDRGRRCSRWRGEYDPFGTLTKEICDP